MCNLAIVIPYYKLSFFEETLKSLKTQSDQRFKVYIGNDASPENPETLLNNYTSQLNAVYHKFDTNIGGTSLVKQWDRCIGLVESEEWIMILGDDDYLGKDVVKSFYEKYDYFKKATNVVRFASQMLFGEDKIDSEIYKHPVWEKAKDSFYRKHKCRTRSSLSEHIFSKKQYLKYKFFNYPLAWHSDDRAWFEFSEQMPIYTINEAEVYVRVSPESISGKQDNLDNKRVSSSLFYNYLVNQKLNDFNKIQRIEIVKSYLERTLIVRKVKFKEWLFLWHFHIRNFTKPSFKKFSKILIKSLFKINHYN